MQVYGSPLSQAHYYSLGWPYLPNFLKISRTISPPEQAEKTADKPTYTHAYRQMREK